jgi:hypothetical protein
MADDFEQLRLRYREEALKVVYVRFRVRVRIRLGGKLRCLIRCRVRPLIFCMWFLVFDLRPLVFGPVMSCLFLSCFCFYL